MSLSDIERADLGTLWDVALHAVQTGRAVGIGAFRMGFAPGSIGHALTTGRSGPQIAGGAI